MPVAMMMDLQVPTLVLLAIATSIGLTMDGLHLIWHLFMMFRISVHARHIGHWLMNLASHSDWDHEQWSMAFYMSFGMLELAMCSAQPFK